MCPKKCVTPHSGSVADRTKLSRSQQATNLQERLKVEGGFSPIRPGPHRVQRTDLPYFCGEVRNNNSRVFKLEVSEKGKCGVNGTYLLLANSSWRDFICRRQLLF
ncbi:hypothetical protein AVEN_100709-1 [Araneus ventricosus]|uniref:Uncharacterized protein n=1 Tax=Araneus ventricosus TaxID=182803 RepID=A0A4Y2CW66_ARAVE|nr:hypothetical protein AVEN_100709-1 [Araneus ventricosus]